MGNNIPRVRNWNVLFWKHGRLVHRCSIPAPTRLLAKLNHRYEHYWEWKIDADKVTYTVERRNNHVLPAEF